MRVADSSPRFYYPPKGIFPGKVNKSLPPSPYPEVKTDKTEPVFYKCKNSPVGGADRRLEVKCESRPRMQEEKSCVNVKMCKLVGRCRMRYIMLVPAQHVRSFDVPLS